MPAIPSLFPAGRRRQAAHGRRNGTAAQRPLSPGQGGVPPLLHLRRQGTACRHRISAAL